MARNFFGQSQAVAMQNHGNRKITFDTQLKTSLLRTVISVQAESSYIFSKEIRRVLRLKRDVCLTGVSALKQLHYQILWGSGKQDFKNEPIAVSSELASSALFFVEVYFSGNWTQFCVF